MKTLNICAVICVLFLETNARVDICIPNSFGVENTKENIEELVDDVKNVFSFHKESKEENSYYIGHVNIDIDHPAMRLIGTLDDVRMYGMEETTLCLLDHFSMWNPAQTFDLFNMTAPNISFTGIYNIKGNVGQLFDIFGEGDFWLHMYDFSVRAVNVTAFIREEDSKEKVCFPINVDVKLNTTECHFHGLMNDPELEELFNKVITKLAPEAVTVMWDEVKQADDEPLQTFIDELIDHIFNPDDLGKMIKLAFFSDYKMKAFPICTGPKDGNFDLSL